MKMLARYLLLVIAIAPAHSGADPTVVETWYLGPFAGLGAALHPDNLTPEPIGFYGTDLGFTYTHGGRLHILFGDTVANERGDRIEASTGLLYDDAFGTIDLEDWPDADAIRPGNIPRIVIAKNPGSIEVAAIDPGHVFDGLKTPEAGFSSGSHEFAVLLLTKPQGCRTDADCENGMSCDTGLGYRGVPYFEQAGLTLGCVDGEPLCVADTMRTLDDRPIGETGLCADRSSSVWADTPAGRVSAISLKQRIGIRSPSNPKKYRTIRDWMTNKFLNTTVRVDGSEAERARVYLWGRPGFIGVGATGRSLGLYLAYAELPRSPDFAFDLRYFAGTDASGAPRFSASEREAAALDLDSTREGIQAIEVHDIVQHMSVVWVEQIGKWLMFYGGGIDDTPLPRLTFANCGLLQVFAGTECDRVSRGDGAIRMRTSDHPWGPWTPPEVVIEGGDPSVPGSGQYGIGGVLQHPACQQPGCAPSSKIPVFHDEGYGWFYGVNIIEPWIKPNREGIDIIWNASTWDPYRVILLKTRIKP